MNSEMELMDMENLEKVSFMIISAAGDAQSMMLGALTKARGGAFEEAASMMKQADKELLKAHKSQSGLIMKEAQGEKSEYSVLMVHAQDHLMNAMLAKQLIGEMIKLYQDIKGEKN